ncbi:MAG: phosphoribosylaminoimidazolesuccinocarboxamide synthase [Bacilli bacterium]
MERGRLLYEGKAKRVYETERPDACLVEFKDDATAFNGQKRGQIEGKGRCNNRISEILFGYVAEAGIATHFLRSLSEREMLVRRVTIIPLEVVTRNIAAGTLATRVGLAEGAPLKRPVVEFYYKNDDLGDPLINRSHALALELATMEQMAWLEETALKINGILQREFAKRNVILVDFKLEFGLLPDGSLLLADEISPDTCRLWDAASLEKLDKDRFRRDLGQVEEAYREILRRLEA